MRLRSLWLVMLLTGLLASQPAASCAQNVSIRDVPLKPWTGFARNWDWTYDALQKLVLSGLASGKVTLTVPTASSAPGRNGTFFHTDLWLMNRSFTASTPTFSSRSIAASV